MGQNKIDNPDIDKTVGIRIRELRKSRNMTQETLSELLGISTNYLGEIERAKRGLSKNVANKICSYFNLTLDYLYHGSMPSSDHMKIKDGDSYYSNTELLHLIAGCNKLEYELCLTIMKDVLEGIRKIKQYRPETIKDKTQP